MLLLCVDRRRSAAILCRSGERVERSSSRRERRAELCLWPQCVDDVLLNSGSQMTENAGE